MDKISRVMFSLIFLLASFNASEAGAKGPSATAPVTLTKAQGRSSVIARAVRPAPVGDNTRMNVSPFADLSDRADEEKFPCASLQITEDGAVCDGYCLDFPEVILKDILEGGEYLPRQSKLVFFFRKGCGRGCLPKFRSHTSLGTGNARVFAGIPGRVPPVLGKASSISSFLECCVRSMQ